MADRSAYILVCSWFEPDGYRPAIVRKGERGATRADFTLDLDMTEAADYLRVLNGRSGFTVQMVKDLVLASCPELYDDIDFGADPDGCL